jgi:hypothetical protein
MKVSNEIIQKFLDAIKSFGRKCEFLKFFKVIN